jgi:hypothetical protein
MNSFNPGMRKIFLGELYFPGSGMFPLRKEVYIPRSEIAMTINIAIMPANISKIPRFAKFLQ